MITTSRTLNLGQLGYELGGVPLRSVGPDDDGVTRLWVVAGDEDEPVPTLTDADLEQAVAAHVAVPDWEPPEA